MLDLNHNLYPLYIISFPYQSTSTKYWCRSSRAIYQTYTFQIYAIGISKTVVCPLRTMLAYLISSRVLPLLFAYINQTIYQFLWVDDMFILLYVNKYIVANLLNKSYWFIFISKKKIFFQCE